MESIGRFSEYKINRSNSASRHIFSNTIIENSVFPINLHVMQTYGINQKPVTFNEIKQFFRINLLMKKNVIS